MVYKAELEKGESGEIFMMSAALGHRPASIPVRAAWLAIGSIVCYHVVLVVLIGTSQLVLLPFAALFINISLARSNDAWRAARRNLLWTAFVPLFGFVSFAVYSAIFVFPLGPAAYGPGVNVGWPPRFAFFTYMLWVVTLGWQAIKSGRRVAQHRVRRFRR